MKKSIVTLLILALPILAFAQPADVVFEYPGDWDCYSHQPLTYDGCWTGTPIPDGTPIDIKECGTEVLLCSFNMNSIDICFAPVGGFFVQWNPCQIWPAGTQVYCEVQYGGFLYKTGCYTTVPGFNYFPLFEDDWECIPLGPHGACCFADGHCEWLTSSACATAGGTFMGEGVSCDPNPCEPSEPPYFIHLTDLHYGYKGARTNVQRVCSTIVYEMDPLPSFVIATGDILSWGADAPLAAHPALDGVNNNYDSVLVEFQMLEDAGIPVIVCPGNHDHYLWPYVPWNLDNYNAHLPVNYADLIGNVFVISVSSGCDYWHNRPWYPPQGSGLSGSLGEWMTDILDDLDGEDNGRDDSDFIKVIMMHHPVINFMTASEGCLCSDLGWPWYWECSKWNAGVIHYNREPFIAMCGQYDVDVVCTGHTHPSTAIYDSSMDGSPSGSENAKGWIFRSGAPFECCPSTADTTLYVITDAAGWGWYRKFYIATDGTAVDSICQEKNIHNNVSVELPWYYPSFRGGERDGGCPAALHLYNAAGEHVGRNSPEEFDFEIEHAVYVYEPITETEETDPALWENSVEAISVSLDEDYYRYEIVGTGDGLIDLSVRKKMMDGSSTNLVYDSIEVSENCVGNLFIEDESVDHIIYMDDDGDGTIDREIEPDTMITAYSPYSPTKPTGATIGIVENSYRYLTNTTDPEDDQIYYMFDWGDDTDSGWLGPYNSGESCDASHEWAGFGTYCVKVRAKDVTDHMGDWSPSLKVRISGGPGSPIVEILSPVGDDTLYGRITVEWTAYDSVDGTDLAINLFYTYNEDETMHQIVEGALRNTGEYEWNAWSLPQGDYVLTILAEDGERNIGGDQTESFIIDNSRALAATLNVDQNSLKSGEKGQPVICYVELPSEYDVRDVLQSSIALLDSVSPLGDIMTIGDNDGDGIEDLMISFPRQAVLASMPKSDAVELVITGVVSNDAGEVFFIGRDTVQVIESRGAVPSADMDAIPTEYALYQNYPNPFNATTTIRYDVKEAGFVSLRVFNLLGREVTVLVDKELPPGYYTTTWDASGLPSGIYLCRMEASGFTQTRKVVLLK